MANGRLKSRYLANDQIAGNTEGKCAHNPEQLAVRLADPFYPRFWEHRLADPIEHPRHYDLLKRKGIFVCDMGELFGDWVPQEWQEQIFYRIKLCPYHRFYLLTKQPQNLIKWSPFPDNCWVGVTATEQGQYNQAIVSLWDVKAKTKYISFEPLLSKITILHPHILARVNWVIIGLQTPYSPKTTPKIEWIEEIVGACDKADVPVFLKNNLTPWLTLCGVTKAQRDAFYLETGLRQEMPNERKDRTQSPNTKRL